MDARSHEAHHLLNGRDLPRRKQGSSRTGSTPVGSPTGSTERILRDTFDDDDRAFIESRDMFFLATADEHGMPQCSYKGGEPGFVRVVDEHTLAFPSYDGNGMYLSLGNLAREPAGRDPVHRLREAEAAAGERDRVDRRVRPAARRVRRGAADRAGAGARRPARTAPATCTGWISSSAHASSRTTITRRRFPTGSGASGRTTCCPKEIQQRRRDCCPTESRRIDSSR